MIDVNAYASVQDAVKAIAERGGGTLRFPAGDYETATVHLPSHIHLQFEEGAVLKAAETGFDEPESSPWTAYQDFGHSHFDNGLLVAKGVEDITISGPGLITGDGRLGARDDGHSGKGGKLIVLKECRQVIIRDITLSQGGHFTILANGVDGLEVANVRIEGQRDGFNVINCRNVVIRDSWIEGGDDALVFKSDYALGRIADSENVQVSNCELKSKNNALQFGTETVGAFRNMRFEDIRCIRAGKAAVGILSCDGAVIEDIHFQNMILEECPTFFFIKIADRGRRPGYRKGIDTGAIRRISFTDIEGRGPMTSRGLELTPTLMGLPHRPIEDITFTNVHLTVHGGHPAADADVDVEDTGFFFSRFHHDVHPAYGWWMRHVRNVTVTDCSVRYTEPDGRPAVVIEDGRDVVFKHFEAQGREPLNQQIRLADSTNCQVTDAPGIDCLQADLTPSRRMRAIFHGYEANKQAFSQVPIWIWNDALTMTEIARQIDDFKLHGIYAFVIYPQVGLPQRVDSMDNSLLEMVRYAVSIAQGRDMRVIFPDEVLYSRFLSWCAAHGIDMTGAPDTADDIALLRNACKLACPAGQEPTFRDYRRRALQFLIHGCNALAPHAFYYADRGPRIDEYPHDVGPHSPWWHQYKPFAEMTGILCWLNTDSEPLGEAATRGQENQLPGELAHNELQIRRVRKDGQTFVMIFNAGETAFSGRLQIGGLTNGVLVDMDGGEVQSWNNSQMLALEPHAFRIITQADPASREDIVHRDRLSK